MIASVAIAIAYCYTCFYRERSCSSVIQSSGLVTYFIVFTMTSFNKRLMSQTENVHRSIDISVMGSSTITTCPFSYSKTCSPFRTTVWYLQTVRTGLGCVTFIHFDQKTTCMLAFVIQLSFDFEPTCIINRFC